MRNFSSSLWPIRYKPLPDELLSCWLVRLAHGHGLKVQTFCNAVFGHRLQVWNRDIDRLAPQWLLNELTSRTGTSTPHILGTTLRSYEGKLYAKFRSAGILNWILVLQMYHRKRNGFGLQFCPTCLANDKVPYFRTSWRIALCTMCTRHKTMLLDRCEKCGAAVAVHRIDMKEREFSLDDLCCRCHSCGHDFRKAVAAEPILYDKMSTILDQATKSLALRMDITNGWTLDSYSVMRQLCRILTARYDHAKLRPFVLEQLGQLDVPLDAGKMSFEMRSITQRHHLLQLAAWLLEDLEPRLTAAWHDGAVRYNLLLKDFPDPPSSYLHVVKQFSNWRDRAAGGTPIHQNI